MNAQWKKQLSKLERLMRELREVETAASELLAREECKNGVAIAKARSRIRDAALLVQSSIEESK